MTTSQDLKEAFALLDSTPIKLGGNNPPNTASFVDDNPDNPVQICDSKGNQLLLMSLEDYEAARAWKPEAKGTHQVPTSAADLDDFFTKLYAGMDNAQRQNLIMRELTPSATSELAQLEAKAMDEILKGTILPAHMLQGAPFKEDLGQSPPSEEQLVQASYDLEPPAVTPTRLVAPSFNTKDSK